MSRMSSRERLERKAAEAEISAKEKSGKSEKSSEKSERPEKKALSPTKSTKSRSTSKKGSLTAAVRQKVVWKVFNAAFKEVAIFPHPNKAEADAMAVKLTSESGQSHFVNSVKIPFDEA